MSDDSPAKKASQAAHADKIATERNLKRITGLSTPQIRANLQQRANDIRQESAKRAAAAPAPTAPPFPGVKTTVATVQGKGLPLAAEVAAAQAGNKAPPYTPAGKIPFLDVIESGIFVRYTLIPYDGARTEP